MSEVKVVTNNHEREMYYLYELSERDQKTIKQDYNWMDAEALDSESFFKYCERWYSLSDFMSLHNKVYNPNPPDFMDGWDGYLSDSFFSGVLIKVLEDNYCIVGTFYG